LAIAADSADRRTPSISDSRRQSEHRFGEPQERELQAGVQNGFSPTNEARGRARAPRL